MIARKKPLETSTSSGKTLEELLLDIFGGNPYCAKARERNGDITYEPVEVPLNADMLQKHIEGQERLGSYQLISGSNVVKWLGWDVDSADLKKARDIALRITTNLGNVPHVIEFSGRKGYHILVFLKEPMMASEAKKIVEYVRDKEQIASTGDTHVECFPKQDKLTKSRPKGNLLKIPLGEHPRTHDRSRFVDPMNGWENGPSLDPFDQLQFKASLTEIREVINVGPAASEQLVKLISEYWVEGKRHDMSLYLSGYLAHEGWSVEASRDLMQKICTTVGDDEVFNRLQTIDSTFERHRGGKSVRGRQGLGEILPINAMQKLTELVVAMRAPDSVVQIDEIRYNRSRAQLENARLAANTIWSILNDEGRIFQTDMHAAYWYNSVDHTVTDETSEMWKSFLNKMFGLNPQDGFSKLVYAELHLRILREAPIVPVYRSSYWAYDENKLYVNLGGSDVYILSGDGEIDKGFNGECGYMFITNESGKFISPDFDADRINCWDYLVNDVSFTTSEDAPAKPDEQKELFKAWILGFFFQELMPTKPILAMLGQPGSGKTTAIRRVLRILEDPEADVLGIPSDKQDAFRTSISSHRLVVMDNLEKSGAGWMVDMLNKLATGNVIEIRALYKTNEKFTIKPRCFVACTAVNMPFSDETLFSRLLVLEMQQLEQPQPEHILQRRIREFGPMIWADLLYKLDNAVSAIKQAVEAKPPNRSRLADFTVFCDKIKGVADIDSERLRLGLMSLVNSQLRQLEESSQAISLLELWISEKPSEANEWHNFHQLYSIFSLMCQQKRQDFKWKSAQGLSRHLLALESRLRSDFFADFKTTVGNNGRENILVRFRVTGEATAPEKSNGNKNTINLAR